MESLLRLAREARESLMPRLRASNFESRGILTAEEFVISGDNLVGKLPGLWKWGTTRDASMRKSYLPEHKQFVYMQGASCLFRVSDAVEDSDWQAVESVRASASHGPRGEQASDSDDDDYREAANKPQLGAKKCGHEEKQEDDEERRGDLAALLFDLEDPSVFADFGEMQSSAAAGEVRKYDISITYDNFYRVPRAFLFGYDSRGSPLSHQQMYSDVLSEYQRTTCTIEPHPHLSTMMLSIHPCKHSHAMLRLIEAQKAAGRTPTVDSYLLLFLKFIQSVVPMIEYDYTGPSYCKVP